MAASPPYMRTKVQLYKHLPHKTLSASSRVSDDWTPYMRHVKV